MVRDSQSRSQAHAAFETCSILFTSLCACLFNETLIRRPIRFILSESVGSMLRLLVTHLMLLVSAIPVSFSSKRDANSDSVVWFSEFDSENEG